MRSAPRTRLAAVAAQVLALSLATSGPARAQLTVFDPANHVENALQTAHQLQSLTNEAQMLINQARELAASPYSHLLETSQALKDIGDLAASVRGILLPFGVWSKSAFLAERPLGYVAAAGLKVLALAIVISLAQSIFEQLQPSENPDLYEALAVLAASLLLAMLAIFIPNLAAALVTGGPSLGAGAALTGTLATGGAAALGFGLAVGAGRALSSGLAATFRTAAGPGSTPPPSPAAGSPPRSPPPSPSPPSSFSPAGSASPAPSSAAETFGPPRRQETIAREAAQAKSDFHRAAGGKPPAGARPSRAGALQAFFAANAARSLLPGQESSGSVSPQLKPREP